MDLSSCILLSLASKTERNAVLMLSRNLQFNPAYRGSHKKFTIQPDKVKSKVKAFYINMSEPNPSLLTPSKKRRHWGL